MSGASRRRKGLPGMAWKPCVILGALLALSLSFFVIWFCKANGNFVKYDILKRIQFFIVDLPQKRKDLDYEVFFRG